MILRYINLLLTLTMTSLLPSFTEIRQRDREQAILVKVDRRRLTETKTY